MSVSCLRFQLPLAADATETSRISDDDLRHGGLSGSRAASKTDTTPDSGNGMQEQAGRGCH